MVLPDGAQGRQPTPKQSSRWMLLLTASMALVVGAWVLATLTALEPQPEAAVTATTSVASADNGWRKVGTVADRVPYGVFRHRDQLFLLTSMPPAQGPQPVGMELWHSADGMTWVQGGLVIRPEAKIDFVGSTALGLFAIGSIGDDETVRAWLSADGVDWLVLTDGLPVDPTEVNRTANDTRAVAAGATLANVTEAIGSDASVIELEVLTDQGIALVSRPSDPSRPYELAEFEIWLTELG